MVAGKRTHGSRFKRLQPFLPLLPHLWLSPHKIRIFRSFYLYKYINKISPQSFLKAGLFRDLLGRTASKWKPSIYTTACSSGCKAGNWQREDATASAWGSGDDEIARKQRAELVLRESSSLGQVTVHSAAMGQCIFTLFVIGINHKCMIKERTWQCWDFLCGFQCHKFFLDAEASFLRCMPIE